MVAVVISTILIMALVVILFVPLSYQVYVDMTSPFTSSGLSHGPIRVSVIPGRTALASGLSAII